MRALIGVVVVVVVAVALFYGIVIAASESGEVVTLHTREASGATHATRLWVVDHAGAEFVRTGHAEKGWFARVLADPHVEVERAGERSRRTAVPVHDAAVAQAVNAEFARKYGAADWIVGLSGDPSKRIPVRLDRTE
jgi:hypothetical protein